MLTAVAAIPNVILSTLAEGGLSVARKQSGPFLCRVLFTQMPG